MVLSLLLLSLKQRRCASQCHVRQHWRCAVVVIFFALTHALFSSDVLICSETESGAALDACCVVCVRRANNRACGVLLCPFVAYSFRRINCLSAQERLSAQPGRGRERAVSVMVLLFMYLDKVSPVSRVCIIRLRVLIWRCMKFESWCNVFYYNWARLNKERH